MKIDITNSFYLELLTCMAISDSIKFTEYNEVTTAANRLTSYEFPEGIKPDLHQICKIIVSLRKASIKSSDIFIRNFAKKDPALFRELAKDQVKPYRERTYKIGNCGGAIIAIANLYRIDYESDFPI